MKRQAQFLEHVGANVNSVAFQLGFAIVVNRGKRYIIDRNKPWHLGSPAPIVTERKLVELIARANHPQNGPHRPDRQLDIAAEIMRTVESKP